MFEGYLELGGGEVLNSARSLGYTKTAPCPVNWLQCPPCDGVRDVLGDDDYTYGNMVDAPWYDAEDEVTHRFLGAHALTIEGIPDSTREADTAEAILDGGVVGRVRRNTRRMRVRAVLSAIGEDALESGFAWLNSALSPGRCGTHADACGAADMQVFTACPPERADITKPEVFWNDPITNLATNPSMETAGAAVTVRTNLAYNPSFEQATAVTVEVRRNLSVDPRATANSIPTGKFAWGVRWYGGSGAGNTTMVTGAADGPTGGPNSYIRKTWTVGAGAGDTGFSFAKGDSSAAGVDQGGVPVTPGQVYTLSAWLRVTGAGARQAQFIVFWRDAAGVYLSNSAQPAVAMAASGQWQRYSYTVTVPSGAAYLGANLDPDVGTWAPGEMLDGTGLLAELSPVLGTYFDGTTLPAGDFTHAWTGTANASASVQYGIAVPGNPGANGSINGSRSIQSTEWASSGSKSLRVISSTPNEYATFYQVGAYDQAIFAAGKTYTVMATARLSQAQTGNVHPNARSIDIITNATQIAKVTAPNAPGAYPLRVTFTVPAAATWCTARLYNGAHVGAGDVWWDDLLIVEGTYTGPYFDGSTPAKVRRNLAPRPYPFSGGYYNTNNIAISVVSYDATVTRRPGIGSSKMVRTVETPSPVLGSWYNVGGTAYTHAGSAKCAPGATYTASAYLASGVAGTVAKLGMAFFDLAGAAVGGTVFGSTVPMPTAGAWYRPTVTRTAPAGAASMRFITDVQLTAGLTVGGEETWLTDVQVEEGAVATEYFDGVDGIEPYVAGWEGAANASPSYLADPDFTYAWTGTANASTSQQKALGVAGVGETYMAQVAQSTQWASNRAHSMRIIPIGGLDAPWSYTSFAFAGLEAGRTYTAIAKIRLTAAQVGPLDGRARKIVAISPGMTTVESNAAPNAAGVTELRITFTLASDPTVVVYLYNGASAAGGDVWYDDFALVAGDYGGTYFDGSFPDSTPADLETVGKNVAEYGWTGTADASTSTHKTGTVIAVEDPVAYQAAIEKLVRNLHTVTCVSGPIVEQKLHRGDAWGYIVEFVLVAAVPWMFGVTKPVALQPSLPIVVQDVPFNLVPYPSAELEAGTVIAATNFSTNPSVEVDATGWTLIADGVQIPGAQVALARSTELWSAGTASIKALFTAAATSAVAGHFGAGQTVLLPGITATTRVSFNLWAVASVESGTAVLGTLNAYMYWQDAAGATIRTDSMGSLPASGGAFTSKSVLAPAGAAKVLVHARINLTSWSAGAKVRLYADALAVSVP